MIAEARRLWADIKIILMSAYSREMVMRSIGNPQVDAFIRKPFRLADLLPLLHAAGSS